MKTLTAIAALAAAAVVPAAASAQTVSTPSFYGSLGYAHTEVDDVNLGAIQGRLGARFAPYFGVEGELAGGVKKDDVNVAGTNVDVELNHQAAIYGVGFLPISPKADLFARVGYGTSEIEAKGAGASARADGDSWNYGVGGQYFFDEKNGVRADYTRHDFGDDGDADVWSIGYTRRF